MVQVLRHCAVVLLMLAVFALGDAVSEARSESVLYVRMYADSSGVTHFEDKRIEIPSNPYYPSKFTYTSFTQASSIGFFRAAATLDMGWHPAPRRQWILVLKGIMEVEVQDGETNRFGPGSILFVEDTSVKGRKTRVVGDEDVLAAWVPVGSE